MTTGGQLHVTTVVPGAVSFVRLQTQPVDVQQISVNDLYSQQSEITPAGTGIDFRQSCICVGVTLVTLWLW